MDDETVEMEQLTDEMRLIMRAWIDDPANEALKARYKQLQDAYQLAFLAAKKGAEASSEA
jgi:hypothetical protein